MVDIYENRDESVQELRRAMGTLPSEAPELRTNFSKLRDIRVNVRSGPENPYVAIFESACATWGDDEYEPKWNRVTPENRFKVVLAALTGNTLPQAIEVCSYLFQVRGTPRWLFEEQAREMNQFTTYLSVGCRDNNKLDATMVVDEGGDYFYQAKENYRNIIEDGSESWQSGRTVLPMGYHHPYWFYTSLLCMMMNYKKTSKVKEEKDGLFILYDKCVSALEKKTPLIASIIRGETITEDGFEKLSDLDKEYFEKEAN